MVNKDYHNTDAHKIAQSTALSQHVKQCVRDTLKRDDEVRYRTYFGLHALFISGLHTFLFGFHIFTGLHT